MDMLNSIRKSEFKSVSNVARHLNINKANLSHYIAKKYSKIGKANRKLIKYFFQEQKWIPTPKPKEKCLCSGCGKLHVKRK